MQKTSVFADFYCLPNKLALMGRSPGDSELIRVVPAGTAESIFSFLVRETQELHQRQERGAKWRDLSVDGPSWKCFPYSSAEPLQQGKHTAVIICPQPYTRLQRSGEAVVDNFRLMQQFLVRADQDPIRIVEAILLVTMRVD
jgi:hypothetical protein